LTAIASLILEWEQDLEVLARHKAAQADWLEARITQLKETLTKDGDQLLTLRDAAKLTGYSVDHIGRLVRNGEVPNAGRPRSPRVRKGDLPLKAGYLPPRSTGTNVDRRQIALSVVTSNYERNDG